MSNMKTECVFLHDTCNPPFVDLWIVEKHDDFGIADSRMLLPVLQVLINDDSGLAPDSHKLIVRR
jgi:hypothetical protein